MVIIKDTYYPHNKNELINSVTLDNCSIENFKDIDGIIVIIFSCVQTKKVDLSIKSETSAFCDKYKLLSILPVFGTHR